MMVNFWDVMSRGNLQMHHPNDCVNMKSYLELFLQIGKIGTPAKLLAHRATHFFQRE